MKTSKEYNEKYREKHRQAIRARQRARYHSNLDEERERSRKKYKHNKIHHPEYFKKWYEKFKNTPKGRMKYYRRNAKTRGISFDLTLEQFTELWQKPCHYCGSEIKQIGIDRINSKKGYQKGNIIPCCFKCNYMKRNWSTHEFLQHCYKIMRFWKQIREPINKLSTGVSLNM